MYEESSGNIDGVVINTVNRDVICSYMFEDYPPNLNNWRIEGDVLKSIVDKPKAEANLICDDAQKIIKEIQFVGYGNPWGSCGSYMQGTCQAPNAKKVVEKVKPLYLISSRTQHYAQHLARTSIDALQYIETGLLREE